MRRAGISVVLAMAAAAAAVALSGVAGAAPTPSGVTIHHRDNDRLYGFVFSPKQRQCAKGRSVKIFRQVGEKQDGGQDRLLAARPAHKAPSGRFKWGYSDDLRGRYYAVINRMKKRGCKGDSSRTIHVHSAVKLQRRLTFTATDLGNNMERWEGKLIARHSRLAECVAHQPVYIQKKVSDGDWTPYDNIHTGDAVGPPKPATARYQGDQEADTGVYRARARRTIAGKTACGKATSEPQRVSP